MLKIEQITVGPLQSNCYIVMCPDTHQAVVVDPGGEADKILETIRELGAKPVMILNTHGHGDHIEANDTIKQTFDIPLAIHEGDAHMLTDPNSNFSAYLGAPITSPVADRILRDGDEVDFAGRKIKVLHTPGHSPGGISLLIENHLFSGDALFKMTVGRTDFPGASHEVLIKGIKEKILSLDDEILVYPGHGPITTVGEERRNNPYLVNE